MAKLTADKAARAVGDQYLLVLMAAQRAKELKRGSQPLVETKKNSELIVAIREIEQGLYTTEDYRKSLDEQRKTNEYYTSKSQRYTKRNTRFTSFDKL